MIPRNTCCTWACVVLLPKVMLRVPLAEVKVPTVVVPMRRLLSLALTPVSPDPVQPNTSKALAPPLRERVSVAPDQLPSSRFRWFNSGSPGTAAEPKVNASASSV